MERITNSPFSFFLIVKFECHNLNSSVLSALISYTISLLCSKISLVLLNSNKFSFCLLLPFSRILFSLGDTVLVGVGLGDT